MDSTTGIAIAIQFLIVAILAKRLGNRALARLGFLFMVSTFFYHGVTEIVQAILPDRNQYVVLRTPEATRSFIILMTGAMALFTGAYMFRFRPHESRFQLRELISNLNSSYFLRWQVLLAAATPGFLVAVALGRSEESSGYWASGLADQFTVLLVTLSLATFCITRAGKRSLRVFILFAALLIAYGERTVLVSTALLSMSAMVRYGVRIPRKILFVVPVIVAALVVTVSASRSSYGRFKSDETLGERFGIMAQSVSSPTDLSPDDIFNDFVYRFDGNSYGAMILEKQEGGMGVTGLTQLMSTISYVVPSFIYRGKLNLDVELRNEKGYIDRFYGFDESIDNVSNFWNLLLGYGGRFGLLAGALILGWITATLDNWLARSATVYAYLAGITLSGIPLVLESGVAGIFYTLRGLAILVVVLRLLTLRGRIGGAASSPRELPGLKYRSDPGIS